MPNNINSLSLACGVIGLFFVLLSTLSSLHRIVPRLLTGKEERLSSIYEDKDGAATVETTASYSTTTPKIIICTLSVLGLSVSVSLAILGTLTHDDGSFIENWLNAASWVMELYNTILVNWLTIVGIACTPSSFRCICQTARDYL